MPASGCAEAGGRVKPFAEENDSTLPPTCGSGAHGALPVWIERIKKHARQAGVTKCEDSLAEK